MQHPNQLQHVGEQCDEFPDWHGIVAQKFLDSNNSHQLTENLETIKS